MVLYYFQILEDNAEMDFNYNYRDLWSICKIARNIALKYLDSEFKPKKLDYSQFQEEEDNHNEEDPLSPKKRNYELLDGEVKEKQRVLRVQIEEHALTEALHIYSKNKFKSTFIVNHKDSNSEPEEKFEY